MSGAICTFTALVCGHGVAVDGCYTFNFAGILFYVVLTRHNDI
jgi:hypothetical protein